MNNLKLDLENCYGIKKLRNDFAYTTHHTQLIYSANDMMKSSLALTLKGFSVTITDFNVWLEEVNLVDKDDIDSLYRAVDELSDYGSFKVKVAQGTDNGWILYAEFCESNLHIKTEKARETFLRIIEEKYCEGMTEDAWYTFHKEMEKDD